MARFGRTREFHAFGVNFTHPDAGRPFSRTNAPATQFSAPGPRKLFNEKRKGASRPPRRPRGTTPAMLKRKPWPTEYGFQPPSQAPGAAAGQRFSLGRRGGFCSCSTPAHSRLRAADCAAEAAYPRAAIPGLVRGRGPGHDGGHPGKAKRRYAAGVHDLQRRRRWPGGPGPGK